MFCRDAAVGATFPTADKSADDAFKIVGSAPHCRHHRQRRCPDLIVAGPTEAAECRCEIPSEILFQSTRNRPTPWIPHVVGWRHGLAERSSDSGPLQSRHTCRAATQVPPRPDSAARSGQRVRARRGRRPLGYRQADHCAGPVRDACVNTNAPRVVDTSAGSCLTVGMASPTGFEPVFWP